MWAFLSSRLRTWLLIAVALPLVRALLRRISAAAERRRPGARSTRLVGRADSVLQSLADRRSRRRAGR